MPRKRFPPEDKANAADRLATWTKKQGSIALDNVVRAKQIREDWLQSIVNVILNLIFKIDMRR